MKKSILILAFFVLIFSSSFIYALDEFPTYKDKYVNDFANVLSAEQNAELRELFYAIDNETTAEVVFVSIESLNGYDISDYAIKLASMWKVGKADKDNGLLILYAKNENKIFVASGYGVEGILPDSKLGRMLDDYYVPYRDSGNVTEGIISLSYALAKVMDENREELLSSQRPKSDKIDTFTIIILIIIIFVIVSKLFSSASGKRRGPWWIPLFIPLGRSSGGGIGSGSFGGGSFGGGGFGGGGAGR